jgi:deoxyribose-phosphate aldolase
LKTSTGKSEYGGATIEAVKTMIDCIKEFNLENKIGIKVSGGIKTKDKVYDYLYLFEELDWNGEIRFGTSSAF